jgi:hypothetical protein
MLARHAMRRNFEGLMRVRLSEHHRMRIPDEADHRTDPCSDMRATAARERLLVCRRLAGCTCLPSFSNTLLKPLELPEPVRGSYATNRFHRHLLFVSKGRDFDG